jgi:hypothetical protein
MAAFPAEAASEEGRGRGEAYTGALLAAGAVALFIGTLFYARLTPRLGLPTSPAERAAALGDALSLGAEKLWLAGSWSFLGDCLLLAACIVLAGGRGRRSSSLERTGWALAAVAAALAMTFDSMTAALFWPLAQGTDPSAFLAIKSWFDFLFASADVPFGVGLIAVLWADFPSGAPLVPKVLGQFGIAVGVAAALSGLAYTIDLVRLPLAIGLSVTFGCVVLATLGVQMARNGRATASEAAA